MTTDNPFVLRPLEPSRRADFEAFFDGDAFACFVVARPERRRGVARALLAAACDGFRARGLALAEGLAVEGAAGEAENHHGPLAMYLAAGLAVAHRFGDGRLLVRRPLA